MHRRFAAFVALSAVAIFCLIGCGSTSQEDPTPAPAAPAATATSAPEDASAINPPGMPELAYEPRTQWLVVDQSVEGYIYSESRLVRVNGLCKLETKTKNAGFYEYTYEDMTGSKTCGNPAG